MPKLSLPAASRDAVGTAPPHPHVWDRQPRTVVVGGGISGLATGLFLMRSGADVVVLEASARTGGVIESRSVAGHITELGPQRTRLAADLAELIESLNLSHRLVIAPDLPLFILSGDRLCQVPLDLQSALTTDLISWRDRLRILAEPFTDDLLAEESTAEFFARKFGRRTYERVFAPLYGDLYGSNPADMPARHALAMMLRSMHVKGSLLRPLLRALRSKRRAPACTFDGGLQVLVDAMARRLGDRVRTSAAVHAIHRDARRFRVMTDAGDVTADRIVLTCPANRAAQALAALEPEAASRLAALQYNTFCVVHLEAEATFPGSGYQIGYREGYATRGVTANQALFGRKHLFTAFLGGATRPGVVQLPDDDVGTIAASEFQSVVGADARPIAVNRTYMPAWDASWNRLDDLRLPNGITVCSNWTGRAGIGGRIADAARTARELAAV